MWTPWGGVGDNDNDERLCLDTESPAGRVSAAEGILQDPRGDLNPPENFCAANSWNSPNPILGG